MNQQGVISSFAGIIAILIVATTVGSYVYVRAAVLEYYDTPPVIFNRGSMQSPSLVPPSQGAVCTQEAKQCPDGSYVGRTGPKCEFEACPNELSAIPSDWKTYRNENFGFEVRYPKELYEGHFQSSIFLTYKPRGPEQPIFSIEVLAWYSGMEIKEIPDFQQIDFEKECQIKQMFGIAVYDCFPSTSFAGERVLIFSKENVPFEVHDGFQDATSTNILSTFKFTK